jgi:hypothetical protein
MGVSADAPYLGIACRVVQYGNRPVLRLSSCNKTVIGEKQEFRPGMAAAWIRIPLPCAMNDERENHVSNQAWSTANRCGLLNPATRYDGDSGMIMAA